MDSGLLTFRPHAVRRPLAAGRAPGLLAALAVHAIIWAACCWSSRAERLSDRSSGRTSASALTVSVWLTGPMAEPAAAPRGIAPQLIEPPKGVATSLLSLTNVQIAPGHTAAAGLPEAAVRQAPEATASMPAPLAYEVRAPRPLPGQSLPGYPESAREDGLEGLVVLAVEVNADGRVVAVRWERRSGVPVLDYAARQAILHWRFEPAHDGLSPVAGCAHVSVRFSLRAAQTVAIAQVQP
jgi:protein TonB